MLRYAKLLAIPAGLLPCGCFFETRDEPPPVGSLVVAWSLDRTTAPSKCEAEETPEINLWLWQTDGDYVGEFVENCKDFSAAIQLEQGQYHAEALLYSDRGTPRARMVDLGSFDIYGNDELTIRVDFPADLVALSANAALRVSERAAQRRSSSSSSTSN